MKKLFLIRIVFLCLAIFIAPSVYAQNSFSAEDLELPDSVLQPSSSVGTLIAAALESAGYEALSIVLVDLKTTFGSMATLIFTVVMMVGLYQLVTGGKVKGAAWMLMGPPVYYFLVQAQVHAAGASWQFGSYDGSRQLEVFIGDKPEENPKVPWVFHRYNLLVSSISQELIKVLTNDDAQHMMKFMVRPKITDELLNANIGSPALNALVQYTFYECAPGFENISALVGSMSKDQSTASVDMTRLSPSARSAYAKAQVSLMEKRINISGGLWQDSLASTTERLIKDKQNGENWERLRPFHQCITDYVMEKGDISPKTFAPGSVVSCAQLWCMVGIGADYEAQSFIEQAKDNNLNQDADEETLNRIVNDIRVKLTNQVVDEDKGINENLAQIQHIIGGKLIRRAFESRDHAGFVSRASENWQYKASRPEGMNNLSVEEQHAQVKHFKEEQLAEREKISIYIFANLIPYIQGVLLYVIAVSYPFFALCILIPGRAQTFLMWMASWVWVKSWDVGWAVVMLIEDLLWELMPLNSIGTYNSNFEAVDMMSYAYGGDPSHSLATYYTIVGMMITSVPLLTAQVILGSKAAIGGILIKGLKDISNSASSMVASRTALSQLRDIDSRRIMGAREYVNRGLSWLMGDRSKPVHPELQAGLNELLSKTGFDQAYNKLQDMSSLGAALKNPAYYTQQGLNLSMLSGKGGLGANLAKVLQHEAVAGNSYKELSMLGAKLERTARAAQAKLIANAADVLRHMYGYTQTFREGEPIRGGVSGRLEFWNMSDTPIQAMTSINQLAAMKEVELWMSMGDIFGQGVNVVRNAGEVGSRTGGGG